MSLCSGRTKSSGNHITFSYDFLGANDKLGDLDLAGKHQLCNANDPDPAATVLAYAEPSGRHFGKIVSGSQAETELRQILKAGKRTIAIQDWHTFMRMTSGSPDHFQYKVVFGSAEGVAAEQAQRNRSPCQPLGRVRIAYRGGQFLL